MILKRVRDMVFNTTFNNIMWWSLSVTHSRSMVFSGTVSSTNKTDHNDITEILLKVALNTIKPNQSFLNKIFGNKMCQTWFKQLEN